MKFPVSIASLALTGCVSLPHFHDSNPFKVIISPTVAENYKDQPCDFLMNALRERLSQASMTKVVHKACRSTFTNSSNPVESVSLTLLPDKDSVCPTHKFDVYPYVSRIYIEACDVGGCMTSTLQCQGSIKLSENNKDEVQRFSFFGSN